MHPDTLSNFGKAEGLIDPLWIQRHQFDRSLLDRGVTFLLRYT